jgi:hypothetical protein
MKVIGVVGSRRRNQLTDLQVVEDALNTIYEPGDTIVSGKCPIGADRFAEIIAARRNISIKFYPANWHKHGRSV